MSDVNWEALCIDLFSLLDAIEKAARETEGELEDVTRDVQVEHLLTLIRGRFQMKEAHGLELQILGTQAGGTQ